MALEKAQTNFGMNVYVDTVPSAETSCLFLCVGVGSVYESDKQAGMSHALEHCVFLGTSQFSTEEAVDDYDGINSISANADTGTVMTRFITSGPYLDPMMRHLGEIVFRPTFPANRVTNETKAIKAEYMSGLDDDENLHSLANDYAMFGRPYGRDVIGYIDRLQFSTNKLRTFWDKYYNVGNMTLVVTGAATVEEVVAGAEKEFYPTNDTVFVPSLSAPQFDIVDGTRTGLLIKAAKTAQISMSVHQTGELRKYCQENQVASKAARIAIGRQCFDSLRNKHGIAYGAGFSLENHNHVNARRVTAWTDVDPSKVTLATDILQKATQTPSSGYSDDKILSAIGGLRGGFLEAADSAGARANFYTDVLEDGVEPYDVSRRVKEVRELGISEVRDAIDAHVRYFSEAPNHLHITGSKAALAGVDRVYRVKDLVRATR